MCYYEYMISYITGEIIKIHNDYIVILTNGIGYQVYISEVIHGYKVGEIATLWTAHIVREDSQTLYGFISESDLEFFHLITTVSGIGPKLASGIIAHIPTETIISAISSRDSGYLSTLPGIGKKTAEKIVLELYDKMTNFKIATNTENPTLQKNRDVTRDVVDALTGLGFHERLIRDALTDMDLSIDIGEIMKSVIQRLSKQK